MLPQQLQFFLDPTSCQQRTDPKEYFFSIVASSLLKEAKYYEHSDESRDKLISTMQKIAEIDPEFILQVAYYVRNQMYIRSVSNFIIAFATIHPKTKPFCSTYACPTMLIPGDLIEVCQFTQIILRCLKDKELENVDIRKQFKIPKILQKQIKKKIVQFSVYQLGKQCSESSRKKNLKAYQELLDKDLKNKRRERRLLKLKLLREQAMQQEDDAQKQFIIKAQTKINKAKKNQAKHQTEKPQLFGENEEKNIFDSNFMTLKDIVQLSHVKEPRSLVMSIIGAKYPATFEQFSKEFTNEPNLQFEAEKAGKKMQIPVPITWDRELSKGKQSKKLIWEELLQKNQVPYLALLRNLRNILKAGVSDIAHQKVVSKLSNPQQVANSKIFPLQYFTALREIEALNKGQVGEQAKQVREVREVKEVRGVRGGRGGRGGKVKANLKKNKKVENQIEQEEEQVEISKEIIKLYQNAIEDALRIAVDKNLDTISGITYVFVDVSGSMRSQISGGKKYGSVNQCMTLAFVLAHLIRTKCEQCEFYLFAAPQQTDKPYTKVEFQNDTLLQGIERCEQEAKKLCGSHEMIGQTVHDLLLLPKKRADNVVILSDMMVTRGFSDSKMGMADVFKEYLTNVNKEAKFFFMDISGYGSQVSFGDDLKSKSCFLINGMSDNVLKYISYAGRLNQIEDVVAYSQELKSKLEIKNSKIQIEQQG